MSLFQFAMKWINDVAVDPFWGGKSYSLKFRLNCHLVPPTSHIEPHASYNDVQWVKINSEETYSLSQKEATRKQFWLAEKIVDDKNSLHCTEGLWQCSKNYRTRAIITRGLYYFYPIFLFRWGLYYRPFMYYRESSNSTVFGTQKKPY